MDTENSGNLLVAMIELYHKASDDPEELEPVLRLDPAVWAFVKRYGLLPILKLRKQLYDEAVRKAVVTSSGINTNRESLDRFREFSRRCVEIAKICDIVFSQAMAWHEAAAASDKRKGNQPDEQRRWAKEALKCSRKLIRGDRSVPDDNADHSREARLLRAMIQADWIQLGNLSSARRSHYQKILILMLAEKFPLAAKYTLYLAQWYANHKCVGDARQILRVLNKARVRDFCRPADYKKAMALLDSLPRPT